MPKDLFLTIIQLIQEQDKIDQKVSKSLEEISDTYILINSKNKIYEALWRLLHFYDPNDYIYWWLYENVEKTVWVDGEKADVSTPEALYDFIFST